MMRLIGSLVAAAAVLVLLVPVRGVDTDPPQCWSVFDYRVPCSPWLSVVAAVGAAVLAFVLVRMLGARRTIE